MQIFCNNIYSNAHEIIGWHPNKGKKNIERRTAVTASMIDDGTGVGIMSEGEAKMVHGKYLSIPRCLFGEVTYHTTT